MTAVPIFQPAGTAAAYRRQNRQSEVDLNPGFSSAFWPLEIGVFKSSQIEHKADT
jgi:hypothetical protein